MAKTIKALIPVKVYERESIVAKGNEFSKQIQVVAIPQKPKINKTHSEKQVREIMIQMFGQRKYNQKYNIGAKR